MARGSYNKIGTGIEQHCIYCGQGTYQPLIPADPGFQARVREFGFEPRGEANWRIFICDRCGNVQLFRLDLLINPDIWGSK